MSIVEFEVIRKFILVSVQEMITTGTLGLYVSFIKFQSFVGTFDVVACFSFILPVNPFATGIAVYEALKVSVLASDVG